MKREVLRLENVTIENKEIIYLEDFNLTIVEGEIIGMIGANHHGLDELISLICDNIPLKYGRVYFNEKLVNTYSSDTKISNRVFLIDQKSRLVPDLSVSDNIFVLRKGFKKYVINRKVLIKQVQITMKTVELSINPSLYVSQLNSFERCAVELIRAVLTGSNLIILREINEVLSRTELSDFFDLIRHYRKKGISFLYIANHHEEVFEICTRFALLKDGKIVKFLFREEMDEEHISPFVKPIENWDKISYKPNKVFLELQNIETKYLHGLSCNVYEGECLTLLDCNNAVMQELVRIIRGEEDDMKGILLMNGKELICRRDFQRLRREVLIIPENPIENMLFSEMTYLENLCFLVDQKLHKSLLNKKIYESICREYESELGEDLVTISIDKLSPKSLYTLIYYKVLLYHPSVICIVQPFLGADMYLRVHIAKLINQLKKKGIAVIILTVHVTDELAVTDHYYRNFFEENKKEKNKCDSP